MPVSSPSPSPMAISRSPSPSNRSIFKKSSSPSLTSAASYLSALSQADARARGSVARSSTSTPALSMSSSISADSTMPEELENHDGLALPARPPTSEQVFTTVHTEFGHCANEQYRYTSQHTPGASFDSAEKEPPYYILLSTYISYLILICLGHVRDFLGKRFHPTSYRHLMPRDVSFCSETVFVILTAPFFRVMLLSTRILTLSTLGDSKNGWTNASLNQSPV